MDIKNADPKDKLRKFSQEHLYYEIAMLYGVVESLAAGVEDPCFYNALLESFVVHASNLLDFFYKPAVRPDDAKAAHYMSDPQAWKALLPPYEKYFKQFDMKRNKRVTHLSYKRLEVEPGDRKWHSAKVTKELRRLVDIFLANADVDLVHPSLSELRTLPTGDS